eukprot:3807992-Rhodomonas_salina.1
MRGGAREGGRRESLVQIKASVDCSHASGTKLPARRNPGVRTRACRETRMLVWRTVPPTAVRGWVWKQM